MQGGCGRLGEGSGYASLNLTNPRLILVLKIFIAEIAKNTSTLETTIFYSKVLNSAWKFDSWFGMMQ
jgi:hypothetical protein